MKRWLVTADANEDLASLRQRMADQGATVADEPPIPLGADEQVLKASGPEDLPDRLRADPGIRDVFPDSEVDLYEGADAGGADAGDQGGSDLGPLGGDLGP